MSDQERLEAIKQRADAATEGPWHFSAIAADDEDEFSRWDHTIWSDREWVCTAGQNEKRQKPNGDAEFIAHARSDIPWLMERLQDMGYQALALSEKVEQLESIVRELAENGATYTNYSNQENTECAVCGYVVDGSLYFRSWQKAEGHAEGCAVARAQAWVREQP